MGYDNAFSKLGYLELIQAFNNCGYFIGKFNGNLSGNSHLVIRHDIDIDIAAALEMAQIEHELGIASTYFISMRSPFYNPFSASNTIKIKKIHDLGHDVGTHINFKLQDGDPFNDINIMKSNFPFLNSGIATVHHPENMGMIKNMLNNAAINSTYGQIFDGSMDYISDSTGKWRYGHPLESNTIRMRKSVILLTHPIWWIEIGDAPLEKIKNMLKKDKLEISDIEDFLPSFFKDNY